MSAFWVDLSPPSGSRINRSPSPVCSVAADDGGVHLVGDRVGRSDVDVGEPRGTQAVAVFGEREGSRDAADVATAFGALRGSELVGGDDVADADASTWGEHTGDFGKHGGLVHGQVEHTVGNDHVDGVRG